MRACLVFLCLLAATFGLSIKSKPHGKHHGLHKTSHTAKEKDVITEEDNNPQILPTLLPFEGSSREQEDEEMSSEDNANANKEEEEFEVTERSEKSTAVLLSDEELVELLKEDTEEEKEAEERVLAEEVEKGKGKGKAESGEVVEEEEAEVEEKTLDDKLEIEEKAREVKDEEEVKQESADAAAMMEKEEEMDVERMSLEEKSAEKTDKEEQGASLGDDDGSTESEIPVDLDYAADSGIFQPIQFASAKKKTHTPSKTDVIEKEASEKGRRTMTEDNEQNRQNTEEVDGKETPDQGSDVRSKETSEPNENAEPEESRTSAESESGSREAGKEERKNKNNGGSLTKAKTRKQKKNQRPRKHSPRSEETGQEQDPQESESSSTENTVPKPKRRRAGKWGPLVGMNPVQIRATVDLYPSSRSSLGGGGHHPEATADPCDNFPCKRGKVCKLDADNKPSCVCQEPSECPPGANEYDHVCGTDNKTYDTSCELFATKCNLEGSKRGHRLHLDYTGPCKLIPACVDTELIQFPLRMRDWLKNVLLQLYDHDSMSPGFLTPKQRFRVKKIFENERRLHAGDHSVELLAQDFEKNYNMYIYPVHWQFAQLDQHPSDRFLSHSELAPLRVPLVPMEHCTSRFFQECDSDKDKQVSFKEWTSCFGIKNEDMDVNQLF